MGTHMVLFRGEEHLECAPSWGEMHDPEMGTPSWKSSYSPTSGGNTWSKRPAATKPYPSRNTTPNDSESWEVRAFAEDASTSGQWPPRSYSCSFCQREFRTAQALGGHMNVHRREREQANQLAQSPSTEAPEAPSHHHHNSSNVTPAASLSQDHHAHHHHSWLTKETQAVGYSHYGTTPSSSSGYEGYYRHAYEEPSYLGNSSYGAPAAFFRNYSSFYEGSVWRSPYETSSSLDAGLDLELRLGQRYD